MTAPVLSRTERKARRLAILNLRGLGHVGAGYDELVRAGFRELAEQSFLAAERDCRGELTNDDGRRRQIDPRTLFTGTETHARRWASDELVEWWEEHGRMTYAEYAEDVLRSAIDELDAAGELDGIDEPDDDTTTGDGPMSSTTTAAPEPADNGSVKPAGTDGSRLLDECRAFIRRFWIPPNDAALDLYVAWLVGTHCTDLDNRMVFETYPHLFFGSKTPASGKSTAVRMGARLAARGEHLSNYTTPGLLGLVDAERASLFLDELDTNMGTGSGSRDFRAFLLDSYKQGGTFVNGNRGQTSKVKRTPVYSPVCLAGMWQNWISNPGLDAVRTRTVMVPCVARTGQAVTVYRSRLHDRDAKALNAALGRWGRRHAEILAEAWPALPDGIDDRDAELVEPLLAIGDAVGGTWPARIRHAVGVMLRNQPDDDELDEPTTPLEMLLADLGLVFGNADRLASRTLVERLQNLPSSPWRRYPSAQAAGREIAEILAPAGVGPRPVWLDGMTVRGYDRAELVAAGMPDEPGDDQQGGGTPLDELPF